MAERRRKSSLHAFVPTKALHSKPKVFFTSSPNPREDLLVKTLHFIPLVKTFASLTCEVFSLREYGWCSLYFALRLHGGVAALIFLFCQKMAERSRPPSPKAMAGQARLHFTMPSGTTSRLHAATAALHRTPFSLACEVAPGFISLCRGKPFHSLVKTFALLTCEVAAYRRVDVFLFTALRLHGGKPP